MIKQCWPWYCFMKDMTSRRIETGIQLHPEADFRPLRQLQAVAVSEVAGPTCSAVAMHIALLKGLVRLRGLGAGLPHAKPTPSLALNNGSGTGDAAAQYMFGVFPPSD